MGKKNKPILDVKHVLTMARFEERDIDDPPRLFVEIEPYGKVNILIQDDTLASLVTDDGDQEEYHRHYGPVRFKILEGSQIRRALWELLRKHNQVLIGVDGRLRITGDGDQIKECIARRKPCDLIHYIKIDELVIFPPKE